MSEYSIPIAITIDSVGLSDLLRLVNIEVRLDDTERKHYEFLIKSLKDTLISHDNNNVSKFTMKILRPDYFTRGILKRIGTSYKRNSREHCTLIDDICEQMRIAVQTIHQQEREATRDKEYTISTDPVSKVTKYVHKHTQFEFELSNTDNGRALEIKTKYIYKKHIPMLEYIVDRYQLCVLP